MVIGEYLKEIYVAGPVIVKNKKLLVILDHEDDFYKFPGGTVKDKEDFVSCVKRETKEEIGVDIDIGELIKDIVIKESEKIIHLLHFRAKIKDEPIKTDEIREYKWINHNESQKLPLTQNVKEIIKILNKRGEL